MSDTNKQPTTDEVESAEVIKDFFKNCNELLEYVYRNHLHSYIKVPVGFEDIEDAQEEFDKHLTHTAKLREENEGLKSQNAVMVEKFRELTRHYPNHNERVKGVAFIYNGNSPIYGWDTVNFAKEALSTLPTTPNLVEQVRELEITLQWYAAPHRPEDYLNDNGERAQQTLNQKAE